MAVARSCNYHAQAIRHIRHLLSTDLATTLACSLILSRLDYCNSLLHGAPTGSERRVQNNSQDRPAGSEAIACTAIRLLRQLHWLPVHHRNDYKLSVMTYKINRSSSPAYLSRHIKLHQSARSLRSSDVPLLDKPTIRTEFAKRSFRYSAPSVWNSLPTNCQ